MNYEGKFPVVTELDSIMTRVGLGIFAFLGPFFNKQTNVNVSVLKTTFYETALKALCGGLFKKISSLRKIKCQLHRHLTL